MTGAAYGSTQEGLRAWSVSRFGLALGATLYPSKVADQTNERAAIDAGISLRRPFLLAAGPADHRIVFVKLGHGSPSHVDVVTLDLVDERRSRDPEFSGGACPIA